MKSYFIGLPQGRGDRPEMRKGWLTLLATAVALAGAGIARNYRPALQRAFLHPSPGAQAAAPVVAAPVAATPVAATPSSSWPVQNGRPTLRDAISLAEESRTALQDVRDYTAEFTKTERINGRLRKQVMEMKLRESPFSVYLLYRSRKEDGRKAIFVEGRDDDKLVVKDVGFKAALGTMRLNLQNPMVTCENRYPVTELGISKVVETALAIWEREADLPGPPPDVTISPHARFCDTDCCEVDVQYQHRRPEIQFQKARVWFDRRTKLPVHAERYGWADEANAEPPLLEAYTYSNTKTNVGLTDADFDPQQYGM